MNEVTPSEAIAALGNQGLQGGWVISNSGDINFLHSLKSQLPATQEAGAGWLRIGFRIYHLPQTRTAEAWAARPRWGQLRPAKLQQARQ